MRVAYYVSGHGYGHATRCYVVIEELLEQSHDVIIVTGAPKSLFQDLLDKFPTQLSFRNAIFESQIYQTNPVIIDKTKTISKLVEFFESVEKFIELEVLWLSSFGAEITKIDIVCVDAGYVPLVASKRLNIPSVIISNFTFDAIFSYIVQMMNKSSITSSIETLSPMSTTSNDSMTEPKKNSILDQQSSTSQFVFNESEILENLVEYYKCADYLIRLPGHIDFPAFLNGQEASPTLTKSTVITTNGHIATVPKWRNYNSRVIPVPLVVRKSRTTRQAIREQLNVSNVPKLVLVSFGGHDVILDGVANAESLLPDGWVGIIAAPNSVGGGRWKEGDKFLKVDTTKFWMPDLVNAVDVVLGKCGYGMCSEVVAHNVPLIYVPRPDFVEEQGLIANLMEPYGYGIEMSQSDYYAGNWKTYIFEGSKLREEKQMAEIITDGGKYVVDAICEILRK